MLTEEKGYIVYSSLGLLKVFIWILSHLWWIRYSFTIILPFVKPQHHHPISFKYEWAWPTLLSILRPLIKSKIQGKRDFRHLSLKSWYLTFPCFLGSFFIPLILIVFLYFKIFTTQQKVASRRKQIKTNTGGQGRGGRQVHRKHKHLWSEWFISGQLYAYISHQSMFCMHYIPVLRQESENKQMRIEMVKGLCILLLLIPYLTLT